MTRSIYAIIIAALATMSAMDAAHAADGQETELQNIRSLVNECLRSRKAQVAGQMLNALADLSKPADDEFEQFMSTDGVACMIASYRDDSYFFDPDDYKFKRQSDIDRRAADALLRERQQQALERQQLAEEIAAKRESRRRLFLLFQREACLRLASKSPDEAALNEVCAPHFLADPVAFLDLVGPK